MLGLVLVFLVVNVVQNARAANRAATSLATPAVSVDAARAAAATFAGDYLSHDPTAAPTGGQEAVRRGLAPGGDPARMAFAGTASLSADVVLPGEVTQIDATHAVVAVQARVTIGMPGNEDAVPEQATTAGPPVPGRTANRPALPAAYRVAATEWISLAVPVIQTDSGVLVDPSGPVSQPIRRRRLRPSKRRIPRPRNPRGRGSRPCSPRTHWAAPGGPICRLPA